MNLILVTHALYPPLKKRNLNLSNSACSHCQLGGHENYRNFYCIFNVNPPSNIPCNRSIETESRFTVLKFTDASNFNFSKGIVIPANSVALAFFNTKLSTKMSTTLSSLSDYIRFRNLTSRFDKQDFLNWLHTSRDATVHTPPSGKNTKTRPTDFDGQGRIMRLPGMNLLGEVVSKILINRQIRTGRGFRRANKNRLSCIDKAGFQIR